MATMTIPDQNPATPEEIWAILRETAKMQKEHERYWAELKERQKEEEKKEKEQQKERQEEAEREAARRREETAKQWEKAEQEAARRQEKVDRQIRATNKILGKLGIRFGEVIEHLVAPRLKKRFGEIGLHFKKISPLRQRFIENGKTVAEADIQLENDECIMVVEVKAKVTSYDIEDHVTRLEKLRGWHDRNNDRRKLLGAIAGAVFGAAERNAARRAGFFVVVQSGDTMEMDIPEGFVPKEW